IPSRSTASSRSTGTVSAPPARRCGARNRPGDNGGGGGHGKEQNTEERRNGGKRRRPDGLHRTAAARAPTFRSAAEGVTIQKDESPQRCIRLSFFWIVTPSARAERGA